MAFYNSCRVIDNAPSVADLGASTSGQNVGTQPIFTFGTQNLTIHSTLPKTAFPISKVESSSSSSDDNDQTNYGPQAPTAPPSSDVSANTTSTAGATASASAAGPSTSTKTEMIGGEQFDLGPDIRRKVVSVSASDVPTTTASGPPMFDYKTHSDR